MVLAKLRILALKVRIKVFVMTMALMQMKHGTLMHGGWFYTTKYGIFGDGGKATERSPAASLTRWKLPNLKVLQGKVWKR